MAAYATIDDLVARWRTLSEAELPRAEALLGDASAMLASELGTEVVGADEGILRYVACAMVRRAMEAGTPGQLPSGVSQASQTAGPYSRSFTLANPTGDLYLTSSERRALGLDAQVVGTIGPVTR